MTTVSYHYTLRSSETEDNIDLMLCTNHLKERLQNLINGLDPEVQLESVLKIEDDEDGIDCDMCEWARDGGTYNTSGVEYAQYCSE